MYRPPQRVNSSDFMTELDFMFNKYKNLIFAGDVNWNILRSNDQDVAEYLHLLDIYGYQILNDVQPNFPTRETSGSILDHFITDLPQSAKLQLEDVSLSDHKLITMNWKVGENSKKRSNGMETKEFKKINSQLYEELVHKYLNSSESPSIEDLISIIAKAKAESSSVTKRQVRKEAFEWITLDVLELMDRKNKAYHVMKTYPEDSRHKEQ